MKKKQLLLLIAVGIIISGIFSTVGCRKNVGTTDISVVPEPIKVESKLVLAVLSSTQDSLASFTMSITNPAGVKTDITGTNKYILVSPDAGKYTIVVTKVGYTSDTKVITFKAVADNVQITQNEYFTLAKLADPVKVTPSSTAPATAAVNIVIKQDETSTAPVSATVSVPINNIMTIKDPGTGLPIVQKEVNITATNITAPAVDIAASAPTNAPVSLPNPDPSGVPGNLTSFKTVDFQPSGLTFTNPITVKMFIGDMFPNATIKARMRSGVVFINGSEKLSPTGFSANGDTAYFKISHFSRWSVNIDGVSATVAPTNTFVNFAKPELNSNCLSFGTMTGQLVDLLIVPNTGNTYLGWILTGVANRDIKYDVFADYLQVVAPGFSKRGIYTVEYETWTLVAEGVTTVLKLPVGISVTWTEARCHNQGGQ